MKNKTKHLTFNAFIHHSKFQCIFMFSCFRHQMHQKAIHFFQDVNQFPIWSYFNLNGLRSAADPIKMAKMQLFPVFYNWNSRKVIENVTLEINNFSDCSFLFFWTVLFWIKNSTNFFYLKTWKWGPKNSFFCFLLFLMATWEKSNKNPCFLRT